MENFVLDHLWESFNWEEITEEEKQKVQEDWQKAKQIKKQIKSNQQTQQKYAKFLSLVFLHFFDDEYVLNYLVGILPELSTEIKTLEVIFDFVMQDYTLSDYIHKLKQSRLNLTKQELDLIVYLISKEKIGKKEFWEKLWDKKGQLVAEVKKELLKIWQK